MAIAACVGALVGRKNKWQYSVSKIIFTVTSAIVAMLLSAIVAYLLASLIHSTLIDLASGIIPEIDSISFATESLKAIFAMLIAPLLFYPMFAICRPVFGLLTVFVGNHIRKATEEKKSARKHVNEQVDIDFDQTHPKKTHKELLKNPKSSAMSALCGGISGLLIFLVLCIPAVGSISKFAGIAAAATKNSDSLNVSLIHDISDGAASNAATLVMTVTGGEAIYNGMTTYPVNGHLATLGNETDFIALMVSAVSATVEDPEDYDGSHAQALLYDTADAFGDTDILPSLLPDLVDEALDAWDDGEDFLDIDDIRPTDEYSGPIITDLLEILEDQDYNTIKEDVSTTLHAIGAIVENHCVAELINDPVILLDDEEATREAIKEFMENERLYVLVADISELGVKSLGELIGSYSSPDGIYEEMTAKLAESTANARFSQNTAELASEYDSIFKLYGIEVADDSLTDLIHRAIISDSTTVADMQQLLSDTELVLIDSDQSEKHVILDSPQAYEQNTVLVFSSDIKLKHTLVEDADREAALLAEGFKNVADIYHGLARTESYELKHMLTDLGPIFDCFRETESIGPEVTQQMLMNILQSEAMISVVRISITDITRLGYELCLASEQEAYTVLFNSLGQTADVIDKAYHNGNTELAMNQLISDLTHASAQPLKAMFIPALMENYGISEKGTQPTADFVAGIFDSLAAAKLDGSMTSEQYEAEAKAMADLVSLAINSDSNGDDTFGENGITGVSAEEFVSRVTDSSVMSQALVDTVYADGSSPTVNPLNSSKKMSDAEKSELSAAINAELASTPDEDKAEKQKVLISAAALLNVSAQISSDGIILE